MKDDSSKINNSFEKSLYEIGERSSSYSKLQQILLIYAVFGCIIGVIAFVYFIIIKFQIDLTQQERILLLVSGSGFSLSLISLVILFFRRQQYKTKTERNRYINAIGEFLFQWGRFERTGKNKLEQKNMDFNKVSIKSIIYSLLETSLITEDDIIILEECLRSRNALVHAEQPFITEDLIRMTNAISEINNRLANS